ncbi:hypothetical protein [Clostridium folliculivorans]|uniref:Uncharacterized protein n=1 Tax=Clostridium folliculivorans TaxID=2886038 RepID=A0A9W5Y3Z7_9CLOT|nr:hypothetical protein [Clostridium folliculivorans]GKU26233.1 hypothetical protein CFOLD11_30600 [Clostridium folliculivorans]GKU31905.1 hypothetical protein CFB3_40130 [Clostridium folliculivorans]
MKRNEEIYDEYCLDKDNLLDDSSLEDLGFIKQLNVTDLIDKAQEKEKKKKLIISDFVYGGVVILVLIIQFNILLKMGVVIWISINSFISLLIPFVMLPKLQKRIKGGIIS